jgi:hypothetical protein
MIYPWHFSLWKNLQADCRARAACALDPRPRRRREASPGSAPRPRLCCARRTDRAQAPCGSCDGCRWFRAGSHPDYRRVEPEALAPARPSARGREPRKPRPRPPSRATEIKVDQIQGPGRIPEPRIAPGRSQSGPRASRGGDEPQCGKRAPEGPGRTSGTGPFRPRIASARAPAGHRQEPLRGDSGRPSGASRGRALARRPRGRRSDRFLAYAGGAPLRAQAYAEVRAGAWDSAQGDRSPESRCAVRRERPGTARGARGGAAKACARHGVRVPCRSAALWKGLRRPGMPWHGCASRGRWGTTGRWRGTP